jgi:antirestriction protein
MQHNHYIEYINKQTKKDKTMTNTNTNTNKNRIYIACLASYNAGYLHGAWIECDDLETLLKGRDQVIKTSPVAGAEEWAIHDYELPFAVSEYESFTTIIEIIEFINESYDKELATAIYNDCKDLGEAQDMIEKYEGSFDSVKDYGEHYAENFMNIPENLSYYIDYEKLGRDYGMDSHKIDANNTTHYFYN